MIMKLTIKTLHDLKCYIILPLLLMNTGALALTQSSTYQFTSEIDLVELMNTDIKKFWETGHFSDFIGRYNIRINYATFQSQKNTQCLIIVPGRTEGYLKYKELAFDMNNQGFNVFIIDHRGQGLSERILDNPHKGYVEFFDNYNEDLHIFIESVVKPICTLGIDLWVNFSYQSLLRSLPTIINPSILCLEKAERSKVSSSL